MEISNDAEKELQQHIKEPIFKISYKDGSNIMFSIADVVAIDKQRVLTPASEYTPKEKDQKNKYTYTVYLISGNEIDVNEKSYNKLLNLKGWN